jgi:uncharacterized protein YprB with RNaseH-like and TPR domain
MRSLREKLTALSGAPRPGAVAPAPKRETAFFVRDTRYPTAELGGIERTALSQVRRVDPLFTGAGWDPHRALFLDTETTGLSGGVGTLAFLVGAGWLEGETLVIRQFLMRDYDEEGPMLENIAELISRFDTYVTFNGKSFDVPLLASRMTMNRLRGGVPDKPHVDLLHVARRVYKLRLERCNLGTLEESVLGCPREGDLPGAQVPERYFAFLKTGEFALLEDVLRHNALDIRSLAVLLARLCVAFERPEQIAFSEDLLGVGRTLEKGGYTQEAKRCYRMLEDTLQGNDAREKLGALYKKERDWPQALAVFRQMIRRGEGGTTPFIELAKYYEHVEKDNRRALSYTRGALERLEQLSLLGRFAPAAAIEVRKREERLLRKLNATAGLHHKEE